MRRRRRNVERPKAQVDMTSLIDLTFLLLVTFIVTLPALEQGVSILLPKAKTEELPTKEKKANVVTVNKDNQIFFNERPITLEMLEKTLKEMASADPEVPVWVRGDERLDYGSLMKVVETVYRCHVRRMSLVTIDKR